MMQLLEAGITSRLSRFPVRKCKAVYSLSVHWSWCTSCTHHSLGFAESTYCSCSWQQFTPETFFVSDNVTNEQPENTVYTVHVVAATQNTLKLEKVCRASSDAVRGSYPNNPIGQKGSHLELAMTHLIS